MVGFTENFWATIAPTNATNQNITWRSSNSAVATVNIQGEITAQSVGTATITATTACGRSANVAVTVTANTLSNSLDGVVIGGIRWATRNVDMPGTFAQSPTDRGMMYQWNRRVAWWWTDSGIVSLNGDTALDTTIPTGTAWYRENDPCPQGWRVPSEEEWRLLIDVGSIWVRYNGVFGNLFGTAPNQIFLNSSSGSAVSGHTQNSYWSGGRNIRMLGSTVYMSSSSPRTNALFIRCVAEN